MVNVFEAENDKLKAENSELKKKLHQVEAERGATVDMYDELRAKVEDLESAARDCEAESFAAMRRCLMRAALAKTISLGARDVERGARVEGAGRVESEDD
ncbi:hypothetical protein LTR15_000357 [Elasticomyces elasticus]|nr:hypothetical protein LTR15_000357 [Elasticomyces elasticus]